MGGALRPPEYDRATMTAGCGRRGDEGVRALKFAQGLMADKAAPEGPLGEAAYKIYIICILDRGLQAARPFGGPAVK